MFVLWLGLLTPLSFAQEVPPEATEESETLTPPAPPPFDPERVNDGAVTVRDTPPPPTPAPERPLAIPTQDRPTTAPIAVPSTIEPSPRHSFNLRAYRDRYLAVRSYRQLSTQTISSHTDVYGSYPHYGWGVQTRPTVLVRARESWAIYQGPVRLDNLDYLSAVGRPDERRLVEADIRKKRSVAAALYGVMGAGVAGAFVGAVGMDTAGTQGAYTQWRAVGIGGLVAVVGGAVGASVPASRSQALIRDLERIRSLPDAQREVAEYNERLRVELELTEEEALGLER